MRCGTLESVYLKKRSDAATHSAAATQLNFASAQVGALFSALHPGEIDRLAQAHQLDDVADPLALLEESVEIAYRIFEAHIRMRAA